MGKCMGIGRTRRQGFKGEERSGRGLWWRGKRKEKGRESGGHWSYATQSCQTRNIALKQFGQCVALRYISLKVDRAQSIGYMAGHLVVGSKLLPIHPDVQPGSLYIPQWSLAFEMLIRKNALVCCVMWCDKSGGVDVGDGKDEKPDH